MRRQTLLVDIPVQIPKELSELTKAFAYVLLNIGSLYELQVQKKLSLSMENEIWRDIPKRLRTADVSANQRSSYDKQIDNLETGIYDLLPISVQSHEAETDLIIGKIFTSEGDSISYYSGVAGIVNNDYNHFIEHFDSKLDQINYEVAATDNGNQNLKEKVPVIKCLDVFSLAGGLDVSHKPICVFFSGNKPENISSLSNMTVFLNLYTSRFKYLTMELAKRYLSECEFLESLSDSEIAMLLLIWLRGHDVGHFIGEDNLSETMSEFDTDYMILHELKSDMIALCSFKLFSDDLLRDGQLKNIYFLTVAEMLRYIRRGNVLKHPDSASAYIAWRYFENAGALKYNSREEKFVLDSKLMEESVEQITKEIVNIFNDGDTERARQFVARYGSLEISDENDLSPKDCSENLKQIVNDTDIPYFINYNFIKDE